MTIFRFLDGESLIKAGCCCKSWNILLKEPAVLLSLSKKFDDLPIHIDPVNGDDCSTSGNCVWPFKTITRAEQWMNEIGSKKTQRKPKCSGLFRPFLLPDAFDFHEVYFNCHESHSDCDMLKCSIGGRLPCHKYVCCNHGIGWGRWIKNSVTGNLFICFDSDAFVCQMNSCKKAACIKHFSTFFLECDVCSRNSKYAKICKFHSKQCLRYVNDDRQGIGRADYREDVDEWDGLREICGATPYWFLQISNSCFACRCGLLPSVSDPPVVHVVSFISPVSLSFFHSCYSTHNCGGQHMYSFSGNFISAENMQPHENGEA
jgi:hypothetical protein